MLLSGTIAHKTPHSFCPAPAQLQLLADNDFYDWEQHFSAL